MKKVALISALALSGLFYTTANAQIFQVGVRLGGGRGPVIQASVAAPVATVSYADDYYYLPEVDAYYSVADEEYYYNDGITWVSAPYLPGAYRNYNWRNVRRYEVHAYRPYLNHSVYRDRYRGNDFNWGRYERNTIARRYDSRGSRPDYNNRNNGRPEPRFDNRNNGRPEPRFENRNNGRPETRYENRGNNNPRGEEHAQGGYNRGNNGRNEQGRGGGYDQPSRGNNQPQQGRSQDNRGGQPSRQNNGGGQRGNNGGGEAHFTSNQGQGSHMRGGRS